VAGYIMSRPKYRTENNQSLSDKTREGLLLDFSKFKTTCWSYFFINRW